MSKSLKSSPVNPQVAPFYPHSLMSPALIEALAELAKTEELPVGALIAVLINEALDRRLHCGGRS